jgi:DHA1 family tetracycline resistance protein-like MFS transporter
MKQYHPHHSASVRFIIATLVIDALGFGMVVPIVPELVLRLSGLTVAGASIWVGALLAVFAGMQFLCAPILGALSDRFGRRPVLLLSLSGICINYLLLAWAPSLPWLFVGRLIAGATAANASTASAYIADVTPPALRATRFGLIGAAFGIGFVLGPAFGGLLGAYGLRLPFLVAAGLAACNVLYGWLVLPESLDPEHRRPIEWSHANAFGSVRLVLADPALRRLAFAWCANWFALGALPSSFVLANQMRFDWNTQQNGLAMGLAGLGSAVVQGLLVRRIVPRLGERRSAMTGAAFTAAGYFCQAIAPIPAFVLLGIMLQALGAIASAAIQAMVSSHAGADRQGETQGALSSLQGLTAIAAPIVASGLFTEFTRVDAMLHFPGAPFLASSVACTLGCWAIIGLRRRTELVTAGPAAEA